MQKRIMVFALIAVALGATGAFGESTETKSDEKSDSEKQSKRDPTSDDQVFTKEYMDRINTNKQAENQQRQESRRRSELLLDRITRLR